MRRWSVIALALALAGCASSSGEKAQGFLNHEVERAYIPLQSSIYLLFEGSAAAVSIGDGIAVTTAHAANCSNKSVIGKSASYDLLFFHSNKATALLQSEPPREGEKIIAYGQGTNGAVAQSRRRGDETGCTG